MFSRNLHTILFVTNDRIARVDVLCGRSFDVVGSEWAQRGELSSLAEAVQSALALGQRRAAKVWVLADDVWSGLVSLPNEVVEAVGANQLEQTLALEAEFDSGLSPFDSLLAYIPTGRSSEGDSCWWVTQAEASHIDAISSALPRRMGRLAGVASGASILAPVTCGDSRNASLADPEAQPGDWIGGQPCDFAAVAQQWLSRALARPSRVPVITPHPKQVGERQQWQLSLLAAIVVFILCYGWNASGRTQRASLSAALAKLEQQEKLARQAINDYEAQLQVAQQRIRSEESRRASESHQRVAFRSAVAQRESTRRFPSLLLQALAATAHPEHGVTRLQFFPQQAVLEGLAVHSQAVAQLAQRLERELRGSGWSVWPPEMSALESSALIRFHIILKPNAATSPPMTLKGPGANDDAIG